jgi:hypothetical protein
MGDSSGHLAERRQRARTAHALVRLRELRLEPLDLRRQRGMRLLQPRGGLGEGAHELREVAILSRCLRHQPALSVNRGPGEACGAAYAFCAITPASTRCTPSAASRRRDLSSRTNALSRTPTASSTAFISALIARSGPTSSLVSSGAPCERDPLLVEGAHRLDERVAGVEMPVQRELSLGRRAFAAGGAIHHGKDLRLELGELQQRLRALEPGLRYLEQSQPMSSHSRDTPLVCR